MEKSHSVDLRQLTEVPSISEDVGPRRLWWAYHIVKRDEGARLRRVMELQPEGRRLVRRPKREGGIA